MFDNDEFVTIEGELKAWTPKAILLDETWIPLSVIEMGFDVENYEKGDKVTIEVKEWWYDKNF